MRGEHHAPRVGPAAPATRLRAAPPSPNGGSEARPPRRGARGPSPNTCEKGSYVRSSASSS